MKTENQTKTVTIEVGHVAGPSDTRYIAASYRGNVFAIIHAQHWGPEEKQRAPAEVRKCRAFVSMYSN